MDLDGSSGTPEVQAVGAGFVGVPDLAVEAVEIESEALLYYPDRTDRVAVNSGTALIWACLDGESTVGEIAVDLAETFSLPYEAMLADVTAAVTDLVGRAMVHDARQRATASPDTSQATARALDDADFPLGDEGKLAVWLDGEVIGLRSNDRAVLTLLRGALASVLVDAEADAEQAIPTLSVLVTPDKGRVAGMSYLYQGDDLVYRSASPGQIVRATLARLEQCLPASDGSIRLNARVLVGKKGAVLVGGTYLEMLDLAGRQLARMGWHLVDEPAAVVDRSDLVAVVNPPTIALDAVGMAALDAAHPPGRDEAPRPGRYEITTVIAVGGQPYPAKPASPSQRLAVLLPLVTWIGAPIQRADVEWLRTLATQVDDVRWLFSTDDQELTRALSVLAGRTPRPALPLPR